MPGVCGVVRQPDASAAVDQMLARMRRFDWHVGRRLDVVGASMGHVAVAPAGATASPAIATRGHLVVAFDGELYAPFQPSADQAMAEDVAAQLLEHGPSFLSRVHGSFACAVWDVASARMSVATDRFGSRPVYWAQTAAGFVFASDLGALLAVDGVSAERDEEGLAQFLCFGQCLGDTTLYKAVRVVPAGSWLTFDAHTGRVTSTAYGTSAVQPVARSDDEWKELIDAAAVSAVHSSCQGGGHLGLSLSGGLDARTILGLAPATARLTCVSLGIPGSIDHRAAAALAGSAGQPHHGLMLAGDFLGQFEPLLSQMVGLTDGQYLDQGIILTTLPAYRELGIQTLLRGHAGELMHMSKAYAFSLDAQALQLHSKAALVDWLWRHLTGYMIGGADPSLFTGPFASRMREMARAALERQVELWDHVEPTPQRIWRVFVAERLRRETALSLQLFRNFVEVRVPFLEPGLVDALLAAPTHLKVGDQLQTFMLRKHRPAFLQVVNANTGAPMGAGPLHTKLAYARMRVYSKLRVPGYQPYERLGLWLAEDLQPLLRRVLLDAPEGPATALEPSEVARLIEQHRSRQRNHTFLLMALLTMAFTQSSKATLGTGELAGDRA